MQSKLKARGEEINRLQNLLHKEKLRTKTNSLVGGSIHGSCAPTASDVENYVLSILDPESTGAHRYPDHYVERTAILMGIINFKLPVMTTSGLGVDIGDYYVESHPELDNQVIYLSENKTGTKVTGSIVEQGNNFGLFDLNNNRSIPDGPLTIMDTNVYHLAMPLYDEAGVPHLPRLVGPDEVSGIDQKGYWYPFLDWQTDTGSITMRLINPSNTSYDVHIQVLDKDGTPRWQRIEPMLANDFGTNVIVNSSAAVFDEGLYSWRLVMFITNFGSGNPPQLLVDWINVNGKLGKYGYKSQEIPDADTLRVDAEKYRVTAMSAWMQYQASSLTDGGDAAMVLYRGGRPAGFNQVFDYQSIAEHPESYSGKVKQGLYGYWEPQDPVDISYRSTRAGNFFRRPYLIASGNYSGDPTTGSVSNPLGILRLRVVTSFEYTSKSQLFNNAPAPVCPKLIELGALALSGEPNVMENSIHIKKLKEIAKKVGQAGLSAVKWGWEHPDTVKSIAGAIAPVALSLF